MRNIRWMRLSLILAGVIVAVWLLTLSYRWVSFLTYRASPPSATSQPTMSATAKPAAAKPLIARRSRPASSPVAPVAEELRKVSDAIRGLADKLDSHVANPTGQPIVTGPVGVPLTEPRRLTPREADEAFWRDWTSSR